MTPRDTWLSDAVLTDWTLKCRACLRWRWPGRQPCYDCRTGITVLELYADATSDEAVGDE